jgi:hypothetical protein
MQTATRRLTQSVGAAAGEQSDVPWPLKAAFHAVGSLHAFFQRRNANCRGRGRPLRRRRRAPAVPRPARRAACLSVRAAGRPRCCLAPACAGSDWYQKKLAQGGRSLGAPLARALGGRPRPAGCEMCHQRRPAAHINGGWDPYGDVGHGLVGEAGCGRRRRVCGGRAHPPVSLRPARATGGRARPRADPRAPFPSFSGSLLAV